MLALAERVRARVGSSSPVELVPYTEAYGEGFEDMDRRQPDITRIHATIGWQPAHSLDEIIDSTAEHMRAALAE